MKNKHGIEIRVGQVWKTQESRIYPHDAKRLEVVALHKNRAIINFENERVYVSRAEGDEFFNNNFHRLIYCPVLGEMEDWDIVTAEQKRDYHVPKEAQIYVNSKLLTKESMWNYLGNHKWPDRLCRVPRGFDWQPYRKDKPATYDLPMDHVEKIRQQIRRKKKSTAPAKIELLPWDLDYDDLPSSEFRHDVLEKLNEIINHLNKEQ